MTVQITQVTRLTGIDPLVEPIQVQVDYTGAVGTITMTDSVNTIATGGASGSSSITGTLSYNMAPANGGASGGVLILLDSAGGFDSINLQLIAMPVGLDPVATQTGPLDIQFDIPDYTIPAGEFTGPRSSSGFDTTEVFDYWSDSTTGDSTQFTRPPVGHSQQYVFSCPRASVAWDFGDTTTSTATNPTHTYAGAGTYHVVLTYVYDDMLTSLTAEYDVVLAGPSGWYVGAIGMGT